MQKLSSREQNLIEVSLLRLFGSKNAAELVTSIKELHYPQCSATPGSGCDYATMNHCVFNFVPLAAAVSRFARHVHTSISSKDGLGHKEITCASTNEMLLNIKGKKMQA